MRPLLVCVITACLAALCFAAAPPGRLPAEVSQWIDQLGHEDADKRAAASKRLEALGEAILPALRRASKSHTDADVRLRATTLAMTIARREIGELERFKGSTSEVTRVVVLSDGKRALSLDEVPRMWDLKSGETLRTYSQGNGSGLSVSKDGKRFAVTADANSALVWQVETKRLVRGFTWNGDNVRVAALSPDGKTLFTGGDHNVRFWNVDSGNPGAKPKKGADYCRAAVWSPDGKFVAAVHFTRAARPVGVLRLWDAKKGESAWLARPHSRMITSVAFSTDGKRLVTTSADKTVKILDVANGKELAVLTGHESSVTAAVFSPDGKRVVSAGADRTVRVWDIATKKVVRCLEGHDDEVLDVAVTTDGKHILSGGKDRTLRLWSMPP